jgi:hypothetical protein
VTDPSAPSGSSPVDLSAFLAAHPPDTDLRVVEWGSDGKDAVRCVLETSPWWVPAEQRRSVDGRMTIECRRIYEAELRVGWRADEVEDLEVSADPLHWGDGPGATLFGSAPLADAAGFFGALTDLAAEFGGGTSALECIGGSYASWHARVTGTAPYHLLGAPMPVVDRCIPLLEERGAACTVLRGGSRASDLRMVVVGESWIVCAESTVVLDPPLPGDGPERMGHAEDAEARE